MLIKFEALLQNSEKWLLAWPYLSVYPSSWNNSAATGRIFMRFCIWAFFEKLSRKFKLYWNLTRIADTLHSFIISKYLALFLTEWEIFFRTGRRWQYNRRLLIARWIIKATHTHTHTHKLRMRNTYCFSKQKWSREHTSTLRFYVHCPVLRSHFPFSPIKLA
jgi:hypothetical protein